MSKKNVCGSACGCAGTVDQKSSETPREKATKKRIDIDFLYLDLGVCSPCRGTAANLEAALSEVAGVLSGAGVETVVNKIHAESMEQAVELGFISSPAIRVNGRDLQLEAKENYCETCSTISGTKTDCRVWFYEGEEYSAAPKEMIVDAVLREVYGGREAAPAKIVRPEGVLENLSRFFEGKRREEPAGAA